MSRVPRLLPVLAALLLAACQTPPDTRELESRNQSLRQQLDIAQGRVRKLEAERLQLQRALDESNRVLEIIRKEKSSRFTESTLLRSQVRRFVQNQIDVYKSFLVDNNLLDYVGGERVERRQYDDQPIMLVDLKNTVPRPGVLTGVGGYFIKPTRLVVKVLRKLDDKLVVVWESRQLAITRAGLARARFHVSVGVEQGDVLGYYFPEAAWAAYDKGTGDTRYLRRDLHPGSTIEADALKGGEEQRAYSLGVYGLLK